MNSWRIHGSRIVKPLTTHFRQVAFATLVLYRMRSLLEWVRQQPAPAGNIVDEAVSLGFAMAGGTQFDVQRVYELVGIETGTNAVMLWKDGEAQIIGRTVDLLLRAIARPDQASVCAARAADMMLALHEYDFSDPRGAVEQERSHLGRLAQAIASVQGAIGPEVLRDLPEYRRGALAAHAASKVGYAWFESFGPAAASFPGPEWRDPYADAGLKDGRDPETTRKGHVEGW
jgi:hypothetical protein